MHKNQIKNILVAGGTGFVGQALIQKLIPDKNFVITVLGRDRNKIDAIFKKNVAALTWDEVAAHPKQTLSPFDVIINLAGENLGGKRLTTARKKLIMDSRVKTTSLLATACAQLENKPRILNASAVSIYGFQEKPTEIFDEFTPISNAHYFLQEVAIAWENALQPAVHANVPVVKMRFAVILGKEAGALPLLSLPTRFGLGAVFGNGAQPFPWVSITDVVKAIIFFMEYEEWRGVFNIVAPEQINQRQFINTLAKVFHRPRIFRIPAWVLKMILGKETAETLLLKGQAVSPRRLSEAQFNFDYPDIYSALKNLYMTES